MDGKKLTKTTVGIPNSCYKCGAYQHVAWFAFNDDEARSGEGLCPKCSGVKQKRKRRTRAQVAEDSAK